MDMYANLLWREGVGVSAPIPNDRRQKAMDKTARMNNAARQDEENRKAAERRRAEAEAEEALRRELRSKIYLTRVEYIYHMTTVQPSFMVLGLGGVSTPSFMSVPEAERAFDEAEKWSMSNLLSRPSEHDRVQVQLPRPGGMSDAMMAIAGFPRNE